MRPPAAKKARITPAQASRAAGSLPTLNVIHAPRPTTGMASPLEGIFRVMGAADWASATDGRPRVAAEGKRTRR